MTTAPGLTFDTGVLIALERRKQRAWYVYREAMMRRVRITVPTVVLAEWWRGRSEARQHVMSGLQAENLTTALAQVAGGALASLPATTIDAIVMASAASRGDIVYTSDFEELERLRAFFPGVRVLAV